MTIHHSIDRHLIALLLFGASACDSPGAGGPEAFRTEVDTVGGIVHVRNLGEPPRWALSPVFRLGGAEATDPSEQFASIRSVAIDSEGLVYISDLGVPAIRAFNSDGSLARSIGREGQGPGEYSRPYAVGLLGDTLAVVDPRNVRVGLFDQDGEWRGQWPYPPITGNNRVFQTSDAEFWATSMRRWPDSIQALFVRYAPEGPTDSVPSRMVREFGGEPENRVQCEGQGSIHGTSADLAPQAYRVPVHEGLIVQSEPVGYRLLFLTAEGDTARIVERVTDEVFVSDVEWQRAVDDYEVFREGIPASANCDPNGFTRPTRERLIEEIFPDLSGRIWVLQRMSDEGEGSDFDVFSTTGVLLGTVHAPVEPGLALPFARDDRLVMVGRDGLDVPLVYLFEIVRD